MEQAIALPPVLDLNGGAALKRSLLAAAAPRVLDASGVQRITTPALQILASAAQGAPLAVAAASSVFAEAVRACGLHTILRLPTTSPEGDDV